MKNAKQLAKDNPAMTLVLTLLTSTLATGGINYDRVLAFLNLPDTIVQVQEEQTKSFRRMEARQILLMKTMFEAGHFKDDPMSMFNLMYPSQRVIDSIMGGD